MREKRKEEMNINVRNKGSYRFYDIENIGDFPSVTTIIGILPKPKIVLWAVMQTIKFLKERGDLSKTSTSLGFVFHKQLLNSLAKEGTNIHKIIEDYVTKQKDNDHNALTRYKEFEKQYDFKCEHSELVVWDKDEYKTAGTVDLVGKSSHIPILFDIKTSKAVRLSHKIQSCIYKELYCKLNKIDSSTMKSGVLLIPRDKPKKWDVYINTQDEEKIYLRIFKILSELFYMLIDLKELDLV